MKANPGECGIGKSSKGADPFKRVVWNKVAPNVTCTFDADKIDTTQQVDRFIQIFGSNLFLVPIICILKIIIIFAKIKFSYNDKD